MEALVHVQRAVGAHPRCGGEPNAPPLLVVQPHAPMFSRQTNQTQCGYILTMDQQSGVRTPPSACRYNLPINSCSHTTYLFYPRTAGGRIFVK
eukprot:6704778-Pyramimonas_sp.AAC.1